MLSGGDFGALLGTPYRGFANPLPFRSLPLKFNELYLLEC